MLRRLALCILFPYTTLFRSLYEVEIRSLLGLPIGNVKVETFDDTGQVFLKHADRYRRTLDRKSTRLNSSHLGISYAVFCLKKKNNQREDGDPILSRHTANSP